MHRVLPLIKANEQSRNSAAARSGIQRAPAGRSVGFEDIVRAVRAPFSNLYRFGTGAGLFLLLFAGAAVVAPNEFFVLALRILFVVTAVALLVEANSDGSTNSARRRNDQNAAEELFRKPRWATARRTIFSAACVFIMSFGPALLAAGAGFYIVASRVSLARETFDTTLAMTPGTQYYSARDLAQQSSTVRAVVRPGDNADADSKENTGEASTQVSLAPAFGRDDNIARRTLVNRALLNYALTLPPALSMLAVFGLLWAIAYFPVALMAIHVTGRGARAHPAYGLALIKNLGTDYVKLVVLSAILVFATALPVAAMMFAQSLPLDFSASFWLVFNLAIGFVVFYLAAVFSQVLCTARSRVFATHKTT